jgi:hypothetical protein
MQKTSDVALVSNDEESAELVEQHLDKDLGPCGGHALSIMFFGVFEGFTLFWILGVILQFVVERAPGLLFMACFGFVFHLATQWGLSMMDPGSVHAALVSLEEGMDDTSTTSIFDELRKIPPTVEVTAEAYHTTRSNSRSSSTTTTVVDHREVAEFQYASWNDITGSVAGLDKYALVAVEVVAIITCADATTTDSLASLKERLLDKCRSACPNSAVRCNQKVSLKHPIYEVVGTRVFVTRSPGAEHPAWMSTSTYTKCRHACPFLGTVYRLLFFRSMPHVRYKLNKQVFTNGGVPQLFGRWFQS